MQSWEWGLFGIAAHLDSDDAIRGVVVGQQGSEGPNAAVLFCRWSLAADGRFSCEPPCGWAGLMPEALDHFQVAVDIHGVPHALVQWSSADWACLTPDAHYPVTPPVGAATEAVPVLRFMARGTVPLVLWHSPERGLVGSPVGIDWPDFQGPDFVRPPLEGDGL